MGKVDLIDTGLIFDTSFEKLKTGLNKKRFIAKKEPFNKLLLEIKV